MHPQPLIFPPKNTIPPFPNFNQLTIPYKPYSKNINPNNQTPIPPLPSLSSLPLIPLTLNLPNINIYDTLNPCTKDEDQKKRFKEIISRPIINKIKPTKKKWKSPLEIAKEFAEIEEIIKSDPISLQKRKKNISQIKAIIKPKRVRKKRKHKKSKKSKHKKTKHKHFKHNETVELFGKTVQIPIKKCNKNRNAKNKIHSNNISNIEFSMTQYHWNKLSNIFNHETYCKNSDTKLICNDQFYHFYESDDYKLMKKLNKNNYTKQIESSKENKLFLNKLSENETSNINKYNKLNNYKFLRHKFPSLKCMDCGNKLIVIPLAYIGYGNINDNKKVNLYKIAAMCANYPNCQFPLYRPTYLKYWVRSAYFDCDTNNNKCKKKQKQKQRQKRKLDNGKNNMVNKKRKLNDGNSGNNDNKNCNVNSYNYLQSLSTICSSKDSSIEP